MADIKQCLVAMYFVFLGKTATTVFTTYNDPINYGTISVKWCDGDFCSSENMKLYPDEVRNIEIGNTELIPMNAFRNAEYLRHIKGVNKNIRILATKSFLNLPVVEKIDLSFNLIRYIHHGVFVNVSVIELNLSWNKIMYVEENALHGIRNLEKLDLSHNEIPVFYDLPSMSPLQKLNLSYNFLGEVDIRWEMYPNLTVLDLSFNRLERFRISSDIHMKKIDVTKNYLKTIVIYGTVEELRIPLNEFTYTPRLLPTKIRKIAIYPNIWKCDELKRLWDSLHKQNITLLRPDDDHRLTGPIEQFPICFMDYRKREIDLEYVIDDTIRNTFQNISLKYIKDNHKPCEEDQMCPDDELCRNRQCFNPCKENVCDFTSMCKVKNHKFRCDCPRNQKRNPMDLDSRCYTAECFKTDDCPESSICKAHLCQKGNLIEF